MANSYSDVSLLILTFIVGATVLVLVYISNLFKTPRDGDSTKNQETQTSQKKAKSSSDVNSASQKSASAASKKKQQQQQQQHSEKWNRDSKQNYTHPWLLTSLKGHSGTVLDMDFSSNGKFLATCAEEDTEELDPGGDGSEQGNSSGSEGNKENNPQESNGCKGALLSRRQKKNRVRRNDGSPVSRNNVTTKKNKSKSRRNNGGSGDSNNRRNATPALRQHTKLNLADRDLSILLRNYILSPDELLSLGYPVESALFPGRAVIFRNPSTNSGQHNSFVSQVPHPHPLTTSSHFFDVNAREFVPMSAKTSGPYYFNDVGQESNPATYVASLVNNQPGIDYSEIGAEWNASHENKGEDQSATSSGSDSGINKSECEDSSSASQEPSDADCTIEEDQGIIPDPKCENIGRKSVKSRQKGRVIEDPICVSDEKKCVRCDRAILVWSTKDWHQKEHKSIRMNVQYDHASLIRWSPDSKAFIIHKATENVVEVCKVVKKADGWISSITKAVEYPKFHEENIIGLGIACNGKYIMSCSEKTDMMLWDLKGQQLTKFDTYLMSTYCARISPCGRFVVASGFAPDVKVWEVCFSKTGEFNQVSRAFELPGHTSGVFDVSFSSDSSRIATVSKDGTWKVFNINVEYKKGEDPHLVITGKYDQASTVSHIALSPNGEVVAITSGSSLQLFSVLTGKCDKTITGIYSGPISSVQFDSLGKYVLTTGEKHVRVFHNVTGYRVTIASTKEKLQLNVSSAQRERMEQQIRDAEQFLSDIGEKR